MMLSDCLNRNRIVFFLVKMKAKCARVIELGLVQNQSTKRYYKGLHMITQWQAFGVDSVDGINPAPPRI